eukprot:UN09885
MFETSIRMFNMYTQCYYSGPKITYSAEDSKSFWTHDIIFNGSLPMLEELSIASQKEIRSKQTKNNLEEIESLKNVDRNSNPLSEKDLESTKIEKRREKNISKP